MKLNRQKVIIFNYALKLTKDEDRILVRQLKTKYPQGAERQLIYASTGRKIDSTMLPADAGCVVSPPVWGSSEGVPPGAGFPLPVAPQAARIHRHRYTLKNRHHFFIGTASFTRFMTAERWIWFQIRY